MLIIIVVLITTLTHVHVACYYKASSGRALCRAAGVYADIMLTHNGLSAFLLSLFFVFVFRCVFDRDARNLGMDARNHDRRRLEIARYARLSAHHHRFHTGQS